MTTPAASGDAAKLTNVEAEAALLGALLFKSTLIPAIADYLAPEHFHEPLHGRIFAVASRLSAEGKPVSPLLLKPFFESDPAMEELGGITYLARLTADGKGFGVVAELAEQIYDYAARRRLYTASTDFDQPLDATAAELADAVAKIGRSAPGGIETLDLAALADVVPTQKRFIIPGLAPAGELTILSGLGSTGKSLFGQQIASALAAGVSALGLVMGQAPSVYLTAEDDEEQLHWRQHHICRALGVPMASLAGRFHCASLRGNLDNALGVFDGERKFLLSKSYHRLAALIDKTGARLVVLDNVSHLFTGNENDRADVTQFVNALNRLAGDTGAAILLLAHPNKSFARGNVQGNAHSGSTAWINAVRSQITLEHDTISDVRTLSIGKANYGKTGEAIRFVWSDWAFVLEHDLPPEMAREMAETAKAASEDAVFIACLRARAAQGIDRSVGPSPSANYAPSQFEGMDEAKGHKRDALRRAMDRLYRNGRIRTDVVERPGKGANKSIIVEVW